MNLTQLRSLVAVAKAGSFTGAAEAVGVTQSGVSQALATLEDSLGVKLVTRQRHGVELTAFGQRAMEHAVAVFAHLDAIRQEAADVTRSQTRSVRIAAFPSVFSTVLPPLLRRFRSLHPGIEVVALETDDREVETWLETGAVDLGVVLNPLVDSATVLIGRDEWVGVLPTNHRLGRTGTLSLGELAAEPFVLATGGCHVHARSLAEAADLSLANVRIEVRDWASAIALVREDVGVSLVPESTLPERRRGLRIARLDLPLSRTFGLRLSPSRAPSEASLAFHDLARLAVACERHVVIPAER